MLAIKFKKTPINKLTLFIAFLSASLLLLLLVIDSNALAANDYGNATAPDLLSGKTATVGTGQLITGTLTNMSTSDPNGIGVGRSSALAFWTGGGNSIYLKPQAGFYDGIDTWTRYTEPNLTPGNIANGVSVLGVTGTFSGPLPTHSTQSWTTPGTYYWTVPAGVSGLLGIVTAGGGGGGCGNYGWDTSYYTAGGGGGGGTNINMVTVSPGQVLTITVGSGGAGGGTNYYSAAPSGTGSSIDSSLVAGAGGGGAGHGSFNGQTLAYGGAGGGYGGAGGSGTSGYPTAAGGAGVGGYGDGGLGYCSSTSTAGGNGRVVVTW